MKTINFEEFEKTYGLIKNHIIQYTPYNGCMFETFGVELTHVREQNIKNI